jgi:predicted deacylase
MLFKSTPPRLLLCLPSLLFCAAVQAQVETFPENPKLQISSKEAGIAEPGSSHRAASVNLKEVFEPPTDINIFPQLPEESEEEPSSQPERPSPLTRPLISAEDIGDQLNTTRTLLGYDIPPATSTRLVWKPSRSFSGMAVDTPVLVVNGANAGPTLCLTAAIHGDELNGIEMIRRVMYNLNPDRLRGMVVGVPIVNLLGFSRNSRYLPDRRDLNRYFPGNATGSVASRLANAFFKDVIRHCNALIDLHTGSFYRTNIPQLRADMSNPMVADFVELFGDIAVLNSSGNGSSLRAAAVRAGIPTVTIEAGEPMRMQRDMVQVGVNAITTLMAKNGMYPKRGPWLKPKPAFFRSAWVRANASGILFSSIELGEEVKKGQVLGEVNNPISNEQTEIVSPYKGRVLGMALDQFVMPGFALYHIGIHAPKGKLPDLPVPSVIQVSGNSEADEMQELQESTDSEEAMPKPLLPEEEAFED